MKTLGCLFCLAAFFVFAPVCGYAQSNTPAAPARASQEQVMQDLLGEVRQLRIALQRMSLGAYRTQMMVERLRLQQDQVARISQELNNVRNSLSELRNARLSFERLTEADDKDKDAAAEPDAKGLDPLENIKQREQLLVEREIELNNELNLERANLADLNKRLDALEREMIMTGAEEDQPKKKTP